METTFLHGTVHEAGEDLRIALRSDTIAYPLWEGLTPLGRNEFICWIEDAKQPATRQRRIKRALEELSEGKKAPLLLAGLRSSNGQDAQQVATGGHDRWKEKGRR